MKAKVRRVRHGKRLLDLMDRYNTVILKLAALDDNPEEYGNYLLDWNDLRGGKRNHDAAGNQQNSGSSTGKDEH